MRRTLAFFLAATALATVSPAGAEPQAPRMPLGRATTPPAGYVEFCVRRPGECREQAAAPGFSAFWRDAFGDDRTSALAGEEPDDRGSTARLPLTAATFDLIESVNREINRAIAPRNDAFAADVWSLPLADGSGVGDCEDYVLEKRRALAARGLPAEAMSVAVVRTRTGEVHAVLLVDTDAGELVLDNRSQHIAAWSELNYRWVKRQNPADPATWVRIGGL